VFKLWKRADSPIGEGLSAADSFWDPIDSLHEPEILNLCKWRWYYAKELSLEDDISLYTLDNLVLPPIPYTLS